jgi:hypothetical protein
MVANAYAAMTEDDRNCYNFDFSGSRRTRLCNIVRRMLVVFPRNGGDFEVRLISKLHSTARRLRATKTVATQRVQSANFQSLLRPHRSPRCWDGIKTRSWSSKFARPIQTSASIRDGATTSVKLGKNPSTAALLLRRSETGYYTGSWHEAVARVMDRMWRG